MSRERRATGVGSPYCPDFPKGTITAGPRMAHYAALGRKASNVFSLEMEREEGGGGSWPPHQRRRPAVSLSRSLPRAHNLSLTLTLPTPAQARGRCEEDMMYCNGVSVEDVECCHGVSSALIRFLPLFQISSLLPSNRLRRKRKSKAGDRNRGTEREEKLRRTLSTHAVSGVGGDQ